jgi:hypothetical protein
VSLVDAQRRPGARNRAVLPVIRATEVSQGNAIR